MRTISFTRHRFPPDIIRHAVWLYVRFTLSYRDVEDLLAERGLDISYESVRRWLLKFGLPIAQTCAICDQRPATIGTSTKWSLLSEGDVIGYGEPLISKGPLSERLKKAFDDVEELGGREKLAERLRQTYEMALEEEARYRPNRRAAYHPQRP